jgi:signal peptidase II
VNEALRARLPLLGIAGGIVVLDQLTKWLVNHSMSLHDSRPLIEGVLSLTYVQNRGAAFGLLSSADLPYQALLFSIVGLLALAAIVAYSLQMPADNRLPQLGLALITGGAVGNLIDRATLGYVIDFIHVYWRQYDWPMFNAADSAISIGVALLILDILRSPGELPEPTTPGTAGAD